MHFHSSMFQRLQLPALLVRENMRIRRLRQETKVMVCSLYNQRTAILVRCNLLTVQQREPSAFMTMLRQQNLLIDVLLRNLLRRQRMPLKLNVRSVLSIIARMVATLQSLLIVLLTITLQRLLLRRGRLQVLHYLHICRTLLMPLSFRGTIP